MKDVIVITGPTASGKTGTSIEIAKRIGGEIVNADSMQVYKSCDIGTAKPSKKELKVVRHHLIDIAEPFDSFSTAAYKSLAEKAIREVTARGKRVVLTGGTGLYIDSLVKNIDFSKDDGTSNIRKKYTEFLESNGAVKLHGLLVEKDSAAADSVHPNNTRRVIRYLEILEGFEGTMEDYRKLTLSKPTDLNYRIFILWPEREFIYKRIEERVDRMIEQGLVDEVRALMDSGITPDMQSMQGIGYKETVSYIMNELGFDEYIDLLKRNTRRYAKRQFTWMKRYVDAVRLDVDEYSDSKGLADVISRNIDI
jgi:tRNA dimethylallyltransferase